MKVAYAAKIWMNYHRSHSKKNTLRSYESVTTPFCRDYGNRELEELTVDLVQAFLESITSGRKPQTRKIRSLLPFQNRRPNGKHLHAKINPSWVHG
jgi:hypothetical protein